MTINSLKVIYSLDYSVRLHPNRLRSTVIHHSSGADIVVGHSWLHKSPPRVSVLRSTPGKLLGYRSTSTCKPGVLVALSNPISWRNVDGGTKSSEVIHLRLSTSYVTEQGGLL